MYAAVLKGADMVAYEFYWRDEVGDIHLIGILPERRKDPSRINDESVMNWIKKIIGNGMAAKEVFFSKVNLNKF